MTLLPQLAAALARVLPYVDRLPASAADEVHAALAAYELHVAAGEALKERVDER